MTARPAAGELLLVAALVCGCRGRLSDEPATTSSPHKRDLLALYAFEEGKRAELDLARMPPSDAALGVDPYRIVRRDRGWVGLLRGANAVVLLDDEGREVARAPAPPAPSAVTVAPDGDVLVVGEGARAIARYRGALERVGSIEVGALGMRGVATAGDAVYVVEERDGRLLQLERGEVRELARCHGPIEVAAIDDVVATNCLLDHAIELRRPGRDVARIQHDGPLWSLALARQPDGGLLIAAGGVEDHPLVREDGGFGYIDSFVSLYRLSPGDAQPVRLAATNVSELGVVTPKWLAFRAVDPPAVAVAGYGSAGLVTLTWSELAAAPSVARAELPPGTAAAALREDGGVIAANPLLDAWVIAGAGDMRVVPAGGTSRPFASRLGEALFFTTAMAPWSGTAGARSRFTCETCHHEGYVDGRIHFTGRGSVHATTRPLYGLFNNRPYFSRALDDSLTQMVHSEFKVANRHNGRDPWFALARTEQPWLAQLGAPVVMSPGLLREALMTFLIDFTHRTNPAAVEQARFTALQGAGAAVFRDRCAGCHAARLVADDPSTAVPFARWEALVRSPAGPIVWSNGAHARTGIEPSVHAQGARVPALRRLYKKWPYFTNGSARSLAEVVERFGGQLHAGAPADLSDPERRALLAFLELL